MCPAGPGKSCVLPLTETFCSPERMLSFFTPILHTPELRPRLSTSIPPDALLSSVKRKIAVRKENEALLKDVKKDLKKATRKVAKSGLLTEQDVIALLEVAMNDGDINAEAEKRLSK